MTFLLQLLLDLLSQVGALRLSNRLAAALKIAARRSRSEPSGHWVPTEATVFSAQMQQSGNLYSGTFYSTEFVYSYSLGGEYFSGEATIPVSRSEEKAQALLDRFPKGTKVMVRYQPDNPSKSLFRVEDQPSCNAEQTEVQWWNIVWGVSALVLGVASLLAVLLAWALREAWGKPFGALAVLLLFLAAFLLYSGTKELGRLEE